MRVEWLENEKENAKFQFKNMFHKTNILKTILPLKKKRKLFSNLKNMFEIFLT